MKKIKIFILFTSIIAIVYLIVSLLFNMSKVKEIPEPTYFKNLFKDNEKIRHFKSEIYAENSITSMYIYGNLNYGILVFRIPILKNEFNGINEIINFREEKVLRQKDQFTKGSIFRDDLKYNLELPKKVEELSIIAKKLNQISINHKSTNIINLSFMINSNIGVEINKKQILFVKKSKGSLPNNLLVLKKGNYIYFLYSKPISNSASEFSLYTKLDDKLINVFED